MKIHSQMNLLVANALVSFSYRTIRINDDAQLFKS